MYSFENLLVSVLSAFGSSWQSLGVAIPAQKTSEAGVIVWKKKKCTTWVSTELELFSASSLLAVPSSLPSNYRTSPALASWSVVWVIHGFSGLISLLKGLLIRDQKCSAPWCGKNYPCIAIFPVGIKVPSFLSGFKIAVSK